MRLISVHRLLLAIVFMSHLTMTSGGGETVETFSLEYWFFFGMSAFLVCFAGVCSGLTVGYLSIKKQSLVLWLNSPDEQKVNIAKTILGILQNHHLLLSTLLLSNALAMQALPIFLDRIVPAYLAVLISTLCVLIFGEVIPQAYCTGPHQIPIAYFMSGFVRFLQLVLGIFVRPIAWFLDNWLGHHEDKIVLNKDNLKTLLQLHKSKDFGYTPEQIELLQNTLDLRSKKVEQCMIPLNKLYMLELETLVNQNLINELKSYNFSSVAVYHGSRSRILGICRVKSFLGISINENKRIRDCIKIEPVVFVQQGRNLLQLFDMLKSKKTRCCIVLKEDNIKHGKYYTFSEQPKGREPIGMINLKRILEQIVLREFGDQDKQKRIISGEFTHQLTIPKNKELIEGVEQD